MARSKGNEGESVLIRQCKDSGERACFPALWDASSPSGASGDLLVMKRFKVMNYMCAVALHRQHLPESDVHARPYLVVWTMQKGIWAAGYSHGLLLAFFNLHVLCCSTWNKDRL